MKRSLVFMAAALVAGAMLIAPADAQMMQGQKQGPGMQGGMMQGMMGQGMMHSGFGFYLNLVDKLELTPSQIEQLRNMKFEFEKGNIKSKAALQVAQIELQQLKVADKVDSKKVEAKIQQVHSKIADIEVALFQAQTRAKRILTAEQQAKLKGLSCPMCGGMHGRGMMQGMMGQRRQGGMMQPDQPDNDPSEHEAHHPN